MNNVFEYYEYYTLKLKTLAPIFIGSGKSVGKKEFCYIPETNRIVFMDMKKIIDYIFENKPEYIKWFEKFMLDDASLEKDTMRKSGEFKGGLRVFLDAINMDEKTRKDCTIYEISNDGVFGESNTLCDIQCFMRGSDGRVYIPGSSLKGMIYTMLLQQLIRKNRNKLGNEKYSINKKKDIEDAEIRPKLTNTLSLKYKKGKPDAWARASWPSSPKACAGASTLPPRQSTKPSRSKRSQAGSQTKNWLAKHATKCRSTV